MLFEFKRTTKTKCLVIVRDSKYEPITTDTIAIHSETSRDKFLRNLAAKHALSLDEIEPDFRSAYQQFVASSEEEERSRSDNLYKIHEQRYVHSESGRAISNFTAEVLEEIILDDGFETSRIFVIEGDLSDGTELRQIRIPAEQFAGMEWVSTSWGVKAIIEAGVGNKDHMRAAIQHFSPHPRQRIVYGHTGWRDHNDGMVYLHAGGAIGGEGEVADIETLLPVQLQPFKLPDPPHGDELAMAIHASLQIRDLAPSRIAVTLLGSIFLAPLGNVEFTTFLFGNTGGGKSSLAALVQQHFSPTSDRANLPANFSSTANANETLASIAKDTILVVDEFVPNGSVVQQQTAHQQADRLFRAQGNGAGRQRLSSEGVLRPQRPPRCLIVATGEVTPLQQSALARLVIVEVRPGDVNFELLTEAQEAARDGVLAACMAGYLQWLAPQIQDIQRRRENEIQQLLAEFQFDQPHARTPVNCANMLWGLHYFLKYAVESGAITNEQCFEYWGEFGDAIRQVATAQCDELI